MEAVVRLGSFMAIFALVALAEWHFPKRARVRSRSERWRINLGMLVLDVVAQRLTVGAAAFAAAIYAREHGWGLFNVLPWPSWIEGPIAFLVLDFAIYLQHVASHALPLLWRLHQVHHADLDVDLTTGIRFHPLEIILSAIFKAIVVAALGADPWVVVVFEAVLNASAIYTHGNVRLPLRLDAALRRAFCTPDMHRIHHSVIPEETNSNFGFFLSVWDRACGTMRRAPANGQAGIEIGLAEHRDAGRLGLADLLLMPLRTIGRGYVLRRRQRPAAQQANSRRDASAAGD